MKNTKLLKKIYYQDKAINRNLQRLINIGLMGWLAKTMKKYKDNEQEILPLKIAEMLVYFMDLLLIIVDLIERKEEEMEDESDELER